MENQGKNTEVVNTTGCETEMKEVTVINDEDVVNCLVVEEGDEFEEHINKYGLKNIRDKLPNGRKENPLNIAVTGLSRKRKSSLIYALRNTEEDEADAAKVRVVEVENTNKYDFPFFLHQLLIDVSNEKKLAMVFGIAGMSKNFIEEKASALGSRIWKHALMSGADAALPIPCVSNTINIAIILEEVIFYRNQFALDDDSLGHLANIANISLNEFKKKVKFKTPEDICTARGLTKYMTRFTAGEVAEKVAQYTMPELVIAIQCGISIISIISAMGVLQAILDMMKQDAIEVLVSVSSQETLV